MPVLHSVLIANRGEIACRIARTARRLGIRTIAVYSAADRDAVHVAACDEAIAIGGTTAATSYLRIDAIVAAAKRCDAQAIHPGYGFLSENASFADACAQANVLFVGPSAAAIRTMGSKSAAKTLLARAGVPLTPGYHGDKQDREYLQAMAAEIGYPVLIKASAGGGGRGMRRVDRGADFAAALLSCQREAQASFNDARVLVEQYLLRSRHVEFQIFADTLGHCIHLYERDCSVQRRHQKVLEEAPAPELTSTQRTAMGAAAIAVALAVGYVGAGTVEFIVAPNGQFYFMEMNTRLQVEHPVTELITGLDLVEWQLNIAAGESLPLTQEQVIVTGHAIEARICAEDPDRGFLPAIGRVTYFSMPESSPHVRVDAGVATGATVSLYYDSLLAKLIVWDKTRALAVARLHAALGEARIVGVTHNIAFLRRLVGTPAFGAADLDTALIDRERDRLFAPVLPPPDAAWFVAALSILVRALDAVGGGGAMPRSVASPWDRCDGWRLGRRGQRSLKLRHGSLEKIVLVHYEPRGWKLEYEGTVVTANGAFLSLPSLSVELDGHHRIVTVVTVGTTEHVFLDGEVYAIEYIDTLTSQLEATMPAGPAGLRAPMPGRVLELIATVGAALKCGAPLLILEAMKIEHTILAPSDGTLHAFKVAVGAQVSEGAELVEFEPVA